MGLFKTNSSYGFVRHKNTKDYTLDELYNDIKDVKVSFASSPYVGSQFRGKQCIIYNMGKYDVCIYIEKGKISIAKNYAEQNNAMKEASKQIGKMAVADLLFDNEGGAMGSETDSVNRAVDEVANIVEKLLNGEKAESNVAITEPGEGQCLYMKEKIFTLFSDKFDIIDENQNSKYWVVGKVTGLGFAIEDGNENEIFQIKKKLVAVLDEYSLFHDGNQVGKIKKKMKLTSPEINGEYNGKEIKVLGNILGKSFKIMYDGKQVGAVDMEVMTFGDCYAIHIFDTKLADIIVASAIIANNSTKD